VLSQLIAPDKFEDDAPLCRTRQPIFIPAMAEEFAAAIFLSEQS
jgi:hypothetical protein